MVGIGKKIKTIRQQKGLSQGDVSKLLKLSVPAYSKIETDFTEITLSRLIQICEILNVKISEFIVIESDIKPYAAEDLKTAHDTINGQAAKILHLQEYIITLYEQLNQSKLSVVNY